MPTRASTRAQAWGEQLGTQPH